MGFFITLLIYAIVFVLSELLAPKPLQEGAKPADLGDFQFPTATEGRVIPLGWGTYQISGPNVTWYGDFEQEAITETVKTGMFSSEEVVVGWRYFVGIQFALSVGTQDALIRVWINDELVNADEVAPGGTLSIDEPELFGGDDFGNGGVEGELEFFSGTNNQSTSSYLEDFQDEGGDTPAYRNFSYLAPASEPIYIGNSTQVAPWKFELRNNPDGLGLGASLAGVGVGDKDANPALVLYQILRNREWGRALVAEMIDEDNFTEVATTLEDEKNGFSFLLDRVMDLGELIKLIEEQIDGILFYNALVGKFQIKLIRADYDPDDLVDLNPDDNIIEVVSYARGSWHDTRNDLRVQFARRGARYAETYARAQDTANVQIQGRVVSDEKRYPGVKRPGLAKAIVWRDLRTLAYPLAKLTLVVNRTLYATLLPGNVFSFTSAQLGISGMPVRITRLDYGQIEDGRIRVDLVEDIFAFALGSFGEPPDTGWDEQADALVDYPADERLVFEAPRGFVTRDPALNGLIAPKIWCAARKQSKEAVVVIRERHAAGTPSGDYAEAGKVFAFMRVGQLSTDLDVGSATPLATLLMATIPDSQLTLEAAFTDTANPDDLGVNLVNLVMVNDEFMLVSSAQISGGAVQLNNVYRGALDSVQGNHAAGDYVYLLFTGGGMTATTFNGTDNVDVKLIPKSSSGELEEASATTIAVDLDNRLRRPYPPSRVTLDGVAFATTVSLEADGVDGEDFGFSIDLRRRDYRTANETASLLADAASIDPTFPAANSTNQTVDVRDDPDGTNTLLYSLSGAGPGFTIDRIDILEATGGVLPARLRLVMGASHTDLGSAFGSRHELVHDFDVTSALTGSFNFGVLDAADVSALYTATVNGTYAFTLSSAFSAGAVEYRLNGGSWTNLITAGGTSGSIVGVVSTDTIEVRHGSSDPATLKFLTMAAAGAGQDGYAVLRTT